MNEISFERERAEILKKYRSLLTVCRNTISKEDRKRIRELLILLPRRTGITAARVVNLIFTTP